MLSPLLSTIFCHCLSHSWLCNAFQGSFQCSCYSQQCFNINSKMELRKVLVPLPDMSKEKAVRSKSAIFRAISSSCDEHVSTKAWDVEVYINPPALLAARVSAVKEGNTNLNVCFVHSCGVNASSESSKHFFYIPILLFLCQAYSTAFLGFLFPKICFPGHAEINADWKLTSCSLSKEVRAFICQGLLLSFDPFACPLCKLWGLPV